MRKENEKFLQNFIIQLSDTGVQQQLADTSVNIFYNGIIIKKMLINLLRNVLSVKKFGKARKILQRLSRS